MLPTPERADKRRTRYLKRIENWTGPLNDEQLRIVEDALGQIPDLAPAWLTYREQQIDRLLLLLDSNPDTDTLAQFVHSWWVRMGRTVRCRHAAVATCATGL